MRVMVLIKATAESEAGIMIKPSEHGKRVVLDGDTNAVTDGPFPETNQLIAGFWIWQVQEMDEAVEWVKRCPQPMPGMAEIEIRPLFETEDFVPEMTPEQAEREEGLREEVAATNSED